MSRKGRTGVIMTDLGSIRGFRLSNSILKISSLGSIQLRATTITNLRSHVLVCSYSYTILELAEILVHLASCPSIMTTKGRINSKSCHSHKLNIDYWLHLLRTLQTMHYSTTPSRINMMNITFSTKTI